MPGALDDPPNTLVEAEERFREFLASRGLPKRIVWVHEADIIFEHERSRQVKMSSPPDRRHLEDCYQQGVKKKLGISLVAHCSSFEDTFATIFIPKDALDAQYSLMGRPGLKLSCPVGIVSASLVIPPGPWLQRLKRNLRISSK